MFDSIFFTISNKGVIYKLTTYSLLMRKIEKSFTFQLFSEKHENAKRKPLRLLVLVFQKENPCKSQKVINKDKNKTVSIKTFSFGQTKQIHMY